MLAALGMLGLSEAAGRAHHAAQHRCSGAWQRPWWVRRHTLPLVSRHFERVCLEHCGLLFGSVTMNCSQITQVCPPSRNTGWHC